MLRDEVRKLALERKQKGRGMGLFSGVFLVFLLLKLAGVIWWSWWWVTVPLWGGVVLFVVIGFPLLMLKSWLDDK